MNVWWKVRNTFLDSFATFFPLLHEIPRKFESNFSNRDLHVIMYSHLSAPTSNRGPCVTIWISAIEKGRENDDERRWILHNPLSQKIHRQSPSIRLGRPAPSCENIKSYQLGTEQLLIWLTFDENWQKAAGITEPTPSLFCFFSVYQISLTFLLANCVKGLNRGPALRAGQTCQQNFSSLSCRKIFRHASFITLLSARHKKRGTRKKA